MARFAFAALALFALCQAGCGTLSDPWEGEPGRKRVVVTIPALASFVQAVGGDDIAIKCLCLDHGPHDYKADSRDAALFRNADLFLSIGLSLDDNFADPLYALARNNQLPHVKLGKKIPKKMLLEMDHDHDHDHDHGDGHHHHHHGTYDPHLWLGIPEAIELVNAIKAELSKIDQENAKTYEKNAHEYIAQLETLKAEGLKKFEEKKNKRIVTFHDSFGYFARTFGLTVAAAMETSPGDEPSAGYLAKIVKICKDETKPVSLITVEPQYSTGSAKKVSDALGGKVPLVTVDPLETASLEELKKEGGQWYLKRMRENVKRLAEALP